MPLTPVRDGLLGEQELGHHLRQRPAGGDQSQRAVLVEALDGREVERERLVQLVHHQPRQLLDVARAGEPRRQPCGEAELLAQVGDLAGGRHALDARVGTMAAQRLGAPPALLGARAGGRCGRELGHGRRPIGRKSGFLEPIIARLDTPRRAAALAQVLQRVLGVGLHVAVAGAKSRHPASARRRRAPAPGRSSWGWKKRVSASAAGTSASHATRSARPAKPLLGSSSSPATATPARIAAQLGQAPPFEADLEEVAGEQVHDHEHRHVGAAQGDAGARDPQAGAAVGHEPQQQHDVDRQTGRAGGDSCAR